MRAACLFAVLGLCGATACTSAERTIVRSPAGEEAAAHLETPFPSTFGAGLDACSPVTPEAARSKAVALYESGDPPLPIPEVVEKYQEVCADVARTRERRRAYDSGDDRARRQDCYCADSMPCSVNRDCTDLVVCHPQVTLADAPGRTRTGICYSELGSMGADATIAR